MKAMTISRAAERAGVGIETIRFYERRGLIQQPLRPQSGGHRCYDDAVIARIRFIRQAQELGFSLREISELLALRADPAADCGDVRSQAIAKRAEIDRKLARLGHIRAALEVLIDTCPGDGAALCACTIVDALAGQASRAAAEPPRSVDLQDQDRNAKEREMKTAIFKIGGLHCDGCTRTIQAIVSALPGVRKAAVSLDRREARILFDPGMVSEDRLATAIQEAGYRVLERP